jgi:hypothetical protein
MALRKNTPTPAAARPRYGQKGVKPSKASSAGPGCELGSSMSSWGEWFGAACSEVRVPSSIIAPGMRARIAPKSWGRHHRMFQYGRRTVPAWSRRSSGGSGKRPQRARSGSPSDIGSMS